MKDTVTILRDTREILNTGGVTGTNYEDTKGRHCYIGAIQKAETGECTMMCSRARVGKAHKYVIEAVKSLLPGWDHDLVTGEVYGVASGKTKLAEAVMIRACSEKAGKEIADIVLTRAIKLAEVEADIISTAKVADEAEMIAQGGHQEDAPVMELEYVHMTAPPPWS